MRPLRCLVLNRWDDDFAAYERYLDHGVHRVAYISSAQSDRLPCLARSAHAEAVTDLGDRQAVMAAASRCHDALGGIDRIIALSEFDLMMAGELRAAFRVPGDWPSDVARYRDKTVMKECIADAGLRVPAFARLNDAAAVDHLMLHAGFPLMLKPRAGAASSGCHRVDSRHALERLLPRIDAGDYECEEFVPGQIFHVDGLVARGRIRFARVSRYINTCYDFARGMPLGSVILSRGGPEAALRGFAGKCLQALGLNDGAFHLELIGDAESPCFLEIGARVGGGEIPFVMRDLFGLDLFKEWLDIASGGSTAHLAAHEERAVTGGFLMLPEPVGKRLVTRPDTLVGKVRGLYDEALPPPGHVFDGTGGYDRILGRFRYVGDRECDVEAAIADTLRLYTCSFEDAPAPPPAAASVSPFPDAGDGALLS